MFAAPTGLLAVSAMAFLAFGVSAPALQRPAPKGPQPPPKNLIHAEGCVQAGVEAHCLVLRDIKTGHFYSLLFNSDRPPAGLGIEFTGVLHPGPTACMQGTAVEVHSWAHKASIKCVPGQAGKPARANLH